MAEVDIISSEDDDTQSQSEQNDRELDENAMLIPHQDTTSPVDKWNINYIIFYLLGMGTLLPWNFFISVNNFWDYKFRNVTGDNDTFYISNQEEKTEMQEEFTSYLAIASNVPNSVFVILNALFGQRFELKYRMFLSMAFVIGLFFFVLTLSKVNSDSWQQEFMDFILVLVVIINCCTAIFQGALFGVAGKFPPLIMGAVMAGQAMGGIFPALVDIFFVVVKVEAKDIGFACFLIATLYLLVSFLCFSWIRQTRYFKFYSNDQVSTDNRTETQSSICEVLKKSWTYCVSIFLIFTTTLAVFPAVTVLVQSQNQEMHTDWTDLYFTPVTCFLLFNIGDYLGRMISTYIQWPGKSLSSQYLTLFLSLVRVTFIPVILFCNAAPQNRSLPVYFPTDGSYIVIMVLFSVSNGYFGNLCMIHGPKLFAQGRDQELSAMILVACLVLGTSCGSFLSYPLISLL